MLGSQTPRLSSCPEGVKSLGEDASLYAEVAGLELFEWQELVMDRAMRVGADGKWSARDVCLIVARQNGKGSILTARCIYGLFVLNERILHTAHEVKTTSDAFQRIKSHIEGKPSLAAQVKRWNSTYGIESIETHKGGRLKFIARTAKSGRGLPSDLVILDEAYELKGVHMTALGPTQQTSKNPQTWYTSSAVDETVHPNGAVLTKQRDRGLARSERLAFLEWSADDSDDREQMTTAAKANPSLGLLIDEQSIIDQRNGLSDDGFDVEILSIGKWPKPQEKREAVFDPDGWGRMKNLTPDLTGSTSLALDRSRDGTMWTLAAAQRTADDRIHLEIGYFGAATQQEMLDYLMRVVLAWDPVAVVIDRKSAANVLEPLLINAGVEPEMTGAPQMASACQGFLDDATSGALSHTGQQVLTDAVAGAVKRILPQGDFAWDTSVGASMSPLVAATLARWGLVAFGVELKPKPAKPSRGTAPRNRAPIHELDVLAAAF